MGKMGLERTFHLENPKRRDHLVNLAVDRDMILKQILFK
jgi:hypothetical protein